MFFNKLRKTGLLLLFAGFFSGCFCQHLTDSLLAYYPFNGNTLDYSGNSYHAWPMGASETTDRFGNTNSAYSFSGTSDFISIQYDFDFPFKTINFWFLVKSFSTTPGIIFSIDHDQLKNGRVLAETIFASGANRFAFMSGANGGNSIISENHWYMFTLLTNADSSLFYLDGKFLAKYPISTAHSNDGSNYTTLGTDRNFRHYFSGKSDDVRIYKRNLAVFEIMDLYNEKSHTAIQTAAETFKSVNISQAESSKIILNFNGFNVEESVNACIYNMAGKLLLSDVFTIGQNIISHPFEIKLLPAGFYFVKIYGSNFECVKRFFIQ